MGFEWISGDGNVIAETVAQQNKNMFSDFTICHFGTLQLI